jgi:hypothetical protein
MSMVPRPVELFARPERRSSATSVELVECPWFVRRLETERYLIDEVGRFGRNVRRRIEDHQIGCPRLGGLTDHSPSFSACS